MLKRGGPFFDLSLRTKGSRPSGILSRPAVSAAVTRAVASAPFARSEDSVLRRAKSVLFNSLSPHSVTFSVPRIETRSLELARVATRSLSANSRRKPRFPHVPSNPFLRTPAVEESNERSRLQVRSETRYPVSLHDRSRAVSRCVRLCLLRSGVLRSGLGSAYSGPRTPIRVRPGSEICRLPSPLPAVPGFRSGLTDRCLDGGTAVCGRWSPWNDLCANQKES